MLNRSALRLRHHRSFLLGLHVFVGTVHVWRLTTHESGPGGSYEVALFR